MFIFCVHYNNGGYMKRILLIIIVFVLINIVSARFYNYDLNDDSYNLYVLYTDNLSTKNIVNYFSDIDVIRIYPRVNPIYKNNIGNVSYKINSSDLFYEINMFKEEYLSLIKKNSYLDYNYLYLNGIDIERIDVYISNNDLYKLLSSDLIITVE